MTMKSLTIILSVLLVSALNADISKTYSKSILKNSYFLSNVVVCNSNKVRFVRSTQRNEVLNQYAKFVYKFNYQANSQAYKKLMNISNSVHFSVNSCNARYVEKKGCVDFWQAIACGEQQVGGISLKNQSQKSIAINAKKY